MIDKLRLERFFAYGNRLNVEYESTAQLPSDRSSEVCKSSICFRGRFRVRGKWASRLDRLAVPETTSSFKDDQGPHTLSAVKLRTTSRWQVPSGA